MLYLMMISTLLLGIFLSAFYMLLHQERSLHLISIRQQQKIGLMNVVRQIAKRAHYSQLPTICYADLKPMNYIFTLDDLPCRITWKDVHYCYFIGERENLYRITVMPLNHPVSGIQYTFKIKAHKQQFLSTRQIS